MENKTQHTVIETADAVEGSWVYRHAPMRVRPFLKLARLDRPVGTWLLLWPCFWSIAFAASPGSLPDLTTMILFAIGAVVMRGAGCTYNDIVDKDFDAQVERTRSRPIPAGEVSIKSAWAFLLVQCLIGLVVLLQFNAFAILVGAASLLLVAAYPFMKRITYWPQAWLGLTFNWGALLGYAAITGSLGAEAVAIYVGGIFWTLGYDTIYAHQDKEDDALIGVKSTALALGEKTRHYLILFYGIFFIALICAGMLANLSLLYYISLAFAALHLSWQIVRTDINDPDVCLRVFRSNIGFGFLPFAGVIASHLL